MKQLLVDLEMLGIHFTDIQTFPGTAILTDDLAPLNKALFGVLMCHFDRDGNIDMAAFMPADKKWEPGPGGWTAADWTFGGDNPDAIIRVVSGWNASLLTNLDLAVQDYMESITDRAKIRQAHALAIAADRLTDNPTTRRSHFVVRGLSTSVASVVSEQVMESVRQDPARWAILRIS